MSIADKLVTIAQNESKVYNAGYEKNKKAFGVSVIVSDVGTVALTHVNSEPHKIKTVVESKNLAEPAEIHCRNCESAQDADTYTFSMTALTYPCVFRLGFKTIIGETYTLSLNWSATSTNNMLMIDPDTGQDSYGYGYCYNANQGDAYWTFTATSEYVYIKSYITYATSPTALESITLSKVQLERGTTKTDYTSRVEPSGVNISTYGKNLFDIDNAQLGYIEAGTGYLITASNETLVNVTAPFAPAIPGETYTLSSILTTLPEGANQWVGISFWDENKQFIVRYAVHAGVDTLTRHAISSVAPDNAAYVRGSARTYGLDNAFIQLELGAATDYEPYKEPTNYTPTADGTLEIDSISPTMTVYSDNPDVRIECEYYQDGAAVKEELTNTIISLGGTI